MLEHYLFFFFVFYLSTDLHVLLLLHLKSSCTREMWSLTHTTSYWGLEELKGPGVEGVATETFMFRDSESRGEGGTSSLVASGDCPRYCDVCECGTSPVEDGVREGWVLSYLFGLCPRRSVDGFERIFPSPSSLHLLSYHPFSTRLLHLHIHDSSSLSTFCSTHAQFVINRN